MRFQRNVDAKTPLVGRLKLFAAKMAVGERAPDVLRVIVYRPEFFGRAFVQYTDALLRRPSEFTVGERELFAAFVSQANDCKFCLGAHCAIAERALGKDLVDSVMSDWRRADLRPEVRAAIGLLEKLTRSPQAMDRSDFDELKKAGVSEDGITTIIHIGVNFSIVNRIADALAFEVPSTTAFSRLGAILTTAGYKF
jgi:uncharacterized peroxidase-related enzyme